jgi:hypothetical protein
MDTYFLGVANANARNAREWMEYATVLEERLLIANANRQAAHALKDVASAELRKLDPKHYLPVQSNRQKISNAAYEDALASGTGR